jgi:transposase-like protein
MEKDGRSKRYSEALKIKVVEELEKGRLTMTGARKQYGIGGMQTIQGWMKRYGKGGVKKGKGWRRPAEESRIERLEEEKRELERALARSCVKVAALEGLLEEAEAFYGGSFKKNIGTEGLNGRRSG